MQFNCDNDFLAGPGSQPAAPSWAFAGSGGVMSASKNPRPQPSAGDGSRTFPTGTRLGYSGRSGSGSRSQTSNTSTAGTKPVATPQQNPPVDFTPGPDFTNITTSDFGRSQRRNLDQLSKMIEETNQRAAETDINGLLTSFGKIAINVSS